MNYKQLSYAVGAALTACLLQTASAQDDHWAGTPGNTAWNVGTNWSEGFVPPPQTGLDPVNGGNVWLDPANGDSVITITPGDVETPGVGGGNPPYNTIFGPEFGVTLNVYGSLSWDWTMAPYSPNPTQRSHINMYNGSSLTTSGASINLGDAWWSGPEFGCFTTLNMYGNAQYSSLGGAGMWFGAHLNVYDNANFLVDGYINMSTAFGECDGTRSIVLGGGTLTLPENTINAGNSGSVTNWIERGVLRIYGKAYDTNDVSITDNGVNTIVTNVPLGGALQRVYFLPLVETNVNIGTFQQSTLVGDYPAVSAVLLGSAEPGIDPALFPAPAYTSSNPNVVTVDTNGVVTAVGLGSATLTAKVGAFNTTNSVSITVAPVVPGLAHEYKFSESPGSTTTADAIGGANGTVNGDATFTGTGQLVLSGNIGSSVSLPAGIVSGLNQVTIEAWATFPSTINANAYLFAFGNTDTSSPLASTFGNGENYIDFSPHSGGATAFAGFGQGNPGNGGEWDAVANQVLDDETNVQIVAVYNPYAGLETLYINGVSVATQNIFNNLTDPIAFTGPTYTNGTILPFNLAADPLNYIGQSLYAGNPNAIPVVLPDPGLLANVDEFRIYTNALTAAQVAADHVLGPNQFIGTSKNVRLSASLSGGHPLIKWPTSSALVSLMSSPALGTNAVWTAVNGNLGTDGNGNYQMTVPATASAQFFRLQP